MSKSDLSDLDVCGAAPPGGLVAPPCLRHPSAGGFELAHATLYEQHAGAVRQPEHRHAVYHLVIFEQADNLFLLDGQKMRSSRGTCVCCLPGVSHSFLPRRRGSTSYHALTFAFETMAGAPDWASLLRHYTGRPVRDVPMLHQIPEAEMLNLSPILAGLRQAVTPHQLASSQRIHFGALQWLGYLADLFDARRRDRALPIRRNPAEQAHDCLAANYAGIADLGEVARQVGVTPAHLNRAFHREYGITPGRYRAALRMEAAGNLLRRSDLLIKEIAFRLGYPDHFTFTKAFHRHYRCSPLAYKARKR